MFPAEAINHQTEAINCGAAAIGLATIVLANCFYLAGLPLILDPMLSMEPFYIDRAAQPLASILSEDPGWGPLYALWLKPFVLALRDPLAVYAANLYALSIATSVLMYLYALVLTRRAAVALGAALFFLICDLNVPLYSKVSGFALLLILAGFTVSELISPGARRMAVAAASVLLASYVRPELYLAAICLCGVALWFAHKEAGASGRGIWLWPSAVIAPMLISALAMGTPLFSPYHESKRLLMALREHFAWNWSRWHGDGHYFMSIWEREFGSAQTLLEAVVANPRVIVHHLVDNFGGTLSFMFATAFNHYPLLAPPTHPALVALESLLVSAALLGSLLVVVTRSSLRHRLLARYGHALFLYVVVAAVSVLSATLVFPKAYYLVLPAVLLILAATLAITVLLPASGRTSWRWNLGCALVCLAVVPKPFVLPSAYAVAGAPFKAELAVRRILTDTIELIRSLPIRKPVRVLTLTDGVGELLGPGFHEVKIWQKGEQPLQAYIREQQVDLIVTLEPGVNSFSMDDPYWRLIRSTPDAAGFTPFSVPNHDVVRVYVRSELVRP